jgi:RNA polymerase sigma factor (sigma-70 family)
LVLKYLKMFVKEIGIKMKAGENYVPSKVMGIYHEEVSRFPLLSAKEEVFHSKRNIASFTLRQIMYGKESNLDLKPREGLLECEPEEKLTEEQKQVQKEMIKEYGGYQLFDKETMLQFQKEGLIDIENTISNGEESRRVLIEHNLRLVGSIAMRYLGRGLFLQELIQEGNIGLIRSAKEYDWRKKSPSGNSNRFSTYATWWICKAISRAIEDSAREIRVPVHVLELIAKQRRVENDLEIEKGRQITDVELSEKLGVSPEELANIREVSNMEPISLESKISTDDGEERMLKENLKDPGEGVEEEAGEVLLTDEINELLKGNLTQREIRILEFRFGLNNVQRLTLDEIGRNFGVCRERIRQIEKKVLDQLREVPNVEHFKEYVA